MEGFIYVMKDIFSQLCFCFRPYNEWCQDRVPPNGSGDFLAIGGHDSSTPSDFLQEEDIDLEQKNIPDQNDENDL